jgi:hypothetical protein
MLLLYLFFYTLISASILTDTNGYLFCFLGTSNLRIFWLAGESKHFLIFFLYSSFSDPHSSVMDPDLAVQTYADPEPAFLVILVNTKV